MEGNYHVLVLYANPELARGTEENHGDFQDGRHPS
jgi:hypothetical protein